MIDQELLHDLTESYLKSLISEASGAVNQDFDSFAPFGELGINSFHVLKILKTLEVDFGTLPKSLLFENFNINDLAKYFVTKHEDVLSNRFAKELEGAATRAAACERPAMPVAVREAAAPPAPAVASAPKPNAAAPVTRAAEPIRILEKDAWAHPELKDLVRALFVRYGTEGCVSRGTRKIAPNLFIGSDRRGYFNYARRKDIVLVYGYAGPREYLPVLAEEMHRYCAARGFQLNVMGGDEAPVVGGTSYSATPFGVMQRVVNLSSFRLDGGPMRRLRYQLSKFEKTGRCRTEEYRPGTNPETDRSIAFIIDRWCESRTVVNPLIYDVKAEILAGALPSDHRLFLTYLDDVLQNAILITRMSEDDPGYLMDLEFYLPNMPLGGLEFAIVQIIEILVREGCDVLSLGGTYGVKLENAPNVDPGVDKILDDLRAQNIFNDEGNLQFKNKFRPDNRPIFLSRPVGSANPDNVIDIIMMIADPLKMQTPDAENFNAGPQPQAPQAAAAPVAETPAPRAAATPSSQGIIEGNYRSRILSEHGFNPLNIPHEHIEFDLKTDSWSQLRMPAIDAQMKHLHGKLQQPVGVDEALRAVFPFNHHVLTSSGQAAENVFFKAWPRKGIALQNLLFPSTIFHEIDKGFSNKEMPAPAVFDPGASDRFKGNMDWDALQAHVAQDPAAIAFVCIEVGNNAAGGAPVSMRHLREVKALLSPHGIALVIDGTRVVENAQLLIEREEDCAGKRVWDVVRETFSYADAVIGSLTKDFCVNKGGIIATNDAKLFQRLQEVLHEENAGIDAIDRKLIALSLTDRKQIETKVVRRMEGVRQIWRALTERGVPVVQPEGGHCVLVDVKQMPEFAQLADPVASFVAWLYLNTGIRAAAHSVGMQRQTRINDLVRFAVPVSLKRAHIEAVIERLVEAFAQKVNIPEVVKESNAPGPMGGVHATYKLVKVHNVEGGMPATAPAPAPVLLEAPAPVPSNDAPVPPPASANDNAIEAVPVNESGEPPVAPSRKPRRTQDIAIVGMAGRYPKAKNLRELWKNLVQGRDCIEEIPAERYERRLHESIEKYRGGFIEDVDKFDSLFFNISPREAEMLDPQERLFLEVAWEAVEDAGYYPEILAQEDASRNIGVYVGAVWAMYQIVGVDEKHSGNRVAPNSFLWSIANRVSYWMNLSGPSLTVDTACSSSLTALYLACEALYAGECSSAIVGGVNLDLHQAKIDINLVGGALSPDGVCRTFGKGANGYVAGEGIGALLLKPLEQAERDGDHIYGVIKSAAVNHGGRTSGYFVPNPAAQGNVIQAALQRANVDARSIGYIEAHGTGTELGDPIEIAGLSNAFSSAEVANQSCAIGSIKTNIGHLEAAAGVVSVSKILLQMQHRQLVPSLHSAEPNPFIDFASSPFYVVQNAEAWTPKEVDGVKMPLRAGISSFGAGGANAHIILESYEGAERTAASEAIDRIFPLSARNEDQLREMAVRFASFLRENRVDLDAVAYTLQHGRKSFEQRLAIVAKTQDELVEKLTAFVEGKKTQDVTAGHAKQAEGVTRLLNRREKQEFVRMLSQGRDPHKIASLWAEGLLADWQGFPAAGQRTSLPTYPFAGKRHWVGDPSAVRRVAQTAAGMHPMVDTNESTFERQLFRKTFHERDFFIYDHLVSDIPTLPGVAYLELARKAGELAAGRPVRRIQNILWVSPIAVESGTTKDVFIELKPHGEAVQFEVFSESAEGKKTLHSQGKLLYTNRNDSEPESIDLDAVRARVAKSIEGKNAYPVFKSVGLNLGPSFQVLQEVYRSESEALGVLKLPEFRHADLQSLVLHPSLIDGSLQAGMAARLGDNVGEMLVPYSIGEVEILHPLQTDCFSYTTEAKDGKKDSRVLKSNVLILDGTGKVLVRIRESTGVPLGDVHTKKDDDADGFKKLHYAYDWQPAPLAADDLQHTPQTIVLFDTDEKLRESYRARTSAQVILVQPGEQFAERDAQTFEIDARSKDDFTRLFELLAERNQAVTDICFAWTSNPADYRNEETLSASLERGITAFLYVCQSVIKTKLDSKVQVVYLYAAKAGEPQPHNEAVGGFLNTLRGESPKLLCKTLEVRYGSDAFDAVWAEQRARVQDGTAVGYESQERYVRKLKAFELGSSAATSLKEKGVYVITGGAGGLGLLFAEFLATQYKARLVLTGRSSVPADRFDGLRNAGAEVHYVIADVSKREDVEKLLGEARERFGEINGIIHSAGVLRDSYVRNKTAEEMRAVFAPKVYGTLHLDELTKSDALDFFVTFSSLAAVTGNPGQSDYSFANAFMDSFAADREALRVRGERRGNTLSVNWALWADGGMKPDDQTVMGMKKILGMKPLSAKTGLDAFARGLVSGRSQFAVLEGIQEKFESTLSTEKKAPAPAAAAPQQSAAAAPAAAQNDGALVGWLLKEMTQIVMEFLKLDASDVQPDKILLDLGFDSIGLTTFANAVNDKFQLDITPILFFDYPSLGEIAKHLAVEKEADLLRVKQGPAAAAASPAPAVQQPAAAAPTFEIKKGWTPAAVDNHAALPVAGTVVAPGRRFVDDPICIVGMSGVMPQSDDLDEFWANLADSKDLVTVVPRDRWNWEDYDGDPLKEANKTNSRWGGFMRQVDKFDPLFFGISPREAQMMDPQQRMFLEHVWKAVEDSGQKVSDLSGTKTGLFVGVGTTDYSGLLSSHNTALDGYTASGASHSITANRVSFLLNLRGPSAPLDTACSSSLIAFHRALESMHSGSCDMAIVGGVQVMLSPAAYISFSSAGMLSPDGKCKTFDKSANGYVRGEGCGAVFLKRLSEAERDGNHIYAVIKATAENHGGKVTTMTAPNSVAQTDLLIEAYEKAQVDPTTVGYIECHGTGTGLGDPIEIQALTKAFSELYKRNNKPAPQKAHCGLSSVKTNIGHLETGAGIAGVLKATLAIKNKAIPANLHLTEVNPYINLAGTPFFIADKLTQWEAPVGADGARLPRRAGVSSFGFGGANAHVVLEEYIAPERALPATARDPQLIVLSAKNAERLDAYVRSMLAYLDKSDVELIDLAYTLQVGRDEMPERLALVVSSTQDLKEKLAAIVAGGNAKDAFRANSRKSSPAVVAEGEAAVAGLVERRELVRLAELWVAGVKVDWRTLYAAGQPRRISAPTYPFARERYWIPETEGAVQQRQQGAVAQLHPLVHRNVSTLKEQKFASRFDGTEFFLADHKVKTDAVLPAVAYVEMIAAAGELSGEQKVRFIRQMSWTAPITVGTEAREVEVSLTPGRTDVEFTVKTTDGGTTVTHCRGQLAYSGSVSEPSVMNVAEIQARCSRETVAGPDLYPFLDTSELNLGKGFQVVQRVHAGESECLAVLQLPQHLESEAAAFTLHPSLLDGALHSAIGIVKKRNAARPWSVPFSVHEVQVFGSLKDVAYAHASWDPKAVQDERSLVRIQIHLLDRNGNVLVRMKDFVAMPFLQPAAQSGPVLQSLVPVWSPAQPRTSAVPASSRVVLLGGDDAQLDWVRASYANARRSDVEGLGELDQLVWIAPDASGDIIAQQEEGVVALFRTIKSLLNLGYANRKLQWTVVTSGTLNAIAGDPAQPAHAGIAGLVGSVAKEFPLWDLRMLDVDSLASVSAAECLSLPYDKQGNALAHRNGEWFQQGLELLSTMPQAEPLYRQNGVYVVIGGAGGVGEVWSRFMIERYQANVVWIGRRECTAEIAEKIDVLSKLGPAPLYISADATDAAALEQARQKILETYPVIHGVVHSAIVLQDQSMTRMDEAAFRASLSAKVDISVNMDRVFGGEALDFMLFFSSIISFFKSPGQSNYSAGCSFKDSFAQKLQRERAYPVCIMNWGYWGSVGVVADDFYKGVMARLGMGSIEPEEGMAALESFLGSGVAQMALIKTLNGDVPVGPNLTEAMTRHLAKQMAPVAAPEVPVAAVAPQIARKEIESSMGSDSIHQIIVETLSKAIRLDVSVIRGDAPLADYGVDSIIGVNFVRTLSEALQVEIEPTKLFEYSTVDELAQYIATLAPPAPVQQASVQAVPQKPVEVVEAIPQRFLQVAPGTVVIEPETSASTISMEPIAIVGMSGRFAESESLDAFWQHLAEGRDLVKQVSRWSAEDCVVPGSNGDAYCSSVSAIDSIDRFDPAFFGIAPQEAKYMDPQQRLFLEESWKALEDAGYAGKGAHEKQCGVYVGCGTSNYTDLFEDNPPPQAWWGNSQSIVPARIAYHLDLQGPAVAVDSACSSALVAIHLACQGLWARETEMALAGGVYVQATSGFHQVGNRAGMLSPDGKCYSFDARANGFAPGEAVGVVVLKRLRDAMRDGDHIHGVIAGSGINQDGRSNGLTAPNGRAQERLERAVYERFDINPETIQVVEAHGTGTLLGDSIEHGAITRSFREHTDRKQFCAIGSVKTNIGHAGNAAGIASVLKLLLSLKNRQIAPSLHFEKSNPAIDLDSSPFYVNTQLSDWNVEGDQKRRGAVSSFGFSGTNAHLVIEEAPATPRVASQSPAYLIVLSARTADQLQEQVSNLLATARSTPDLSLNDLSYSLFVGRMHLAHRLSCVARSQAELVQLLEQWLEAGSANHVFTAELPQGRVREQAALKKFGNYCIRECREATEATGYVENLSAIADLYVQGYALDYAALFPRESRRMPLPTYPFARERYWVEDARTARPAQVATARLHTVTEADVAAARAMEPVWMFVKEPGVSHDSMSPVEKIELFLKQEAALHLHVPIETVATDLSYFDLGLTSLAIAHLIRNLGQLLEEDLSPSALFDYIDIQSLAGYLAQTYPERIDVLKVTRRAAAESCAVELPHHAKLTIVAPVAEVDAEEMLGQVLWQDDEALEGSYEKVTF